MVRSSGKVTIKKYANRRLYDTESSTYITLDRLAQMVREGREFEVVDAKSGEDITRQVLTQIIVDEEARGGTMAIAAANLTEVERVVTLAAPWNFARYPESSSQALQDMWRHSKAAAKALGALPMEVLQAAFWSLDPERTVRKFAEFGRLSPGSVKSLSFVELEEWANEGEPLPYPAANELVEDLFDRRRQ